MFHKPLALSVLAMLVGSPLAIAQYGDPSDGRGPAWFEGPARPLIGGSGLPTGGSNPAQVRWDGAPGPMYGRQQQPQQRQQQRMAYDTDGTPGYGSGYANEAPAGITPVSHGNILGRPGVAETPWCGDMPCGANCSGPVGRNGPITYELYLRTGPSLLAGAQQFDGNLKDGWTVQGGGRTLFFNQARSAAWVIDTGMGFTNNDGNRLGNTFGIQASQLKGGNPNDPALLIVGIRALHRTGVNFGIGRDWWLNGPGTVGENNFGNWRFGTDVGGRYGTASVSFEPASDPNGSRRIHDVYHGVYIGSQLNWEIPVYTYLSFIGFRAEWSYTYTNLLPPNGGNIKDVNLMLMMGMRF